MKLGLGNCAAFDWVHDWVQAALRKSGQYASYVGIGGVLTFRNQAGQKKYLEKDNNLSFEPLAIFS